MKASVPAGKISKSFGVSGELIINLYDNFPEKIDMEEPLSVSIDSLTVPLFLEKFERRGVSSALVRFSDFDTNERAAELIGLEFSLYRDPVKDAGGVGNDGDDEIYLEHLTGYKVFFTDAGITGVIDSYIDSEHNPLFSITINGKEVLVPASGDFIEALDFDRRTITFSLPEGLLELYL